MPVKIKKSKETTAAKMPERTAETLPGRPEAAHPLLTLRQEIDNLFDSFFSSFSLGPFGRHRFDVDPFQRMEEAFTAFGPLTPRCDFSETAKQYRVTVELPGMGEDDIEVALSDDVLLVKGEKKEEKSEKKEDFHLTERRYGSFFRSFRVPRSVDQDKVEAAFKKGILEVVLPKKASAVTATKKIKIKGK